jgi:ubiquinone/menaquinone biosynthesis C-methylase UbiE
MEDTREKQRELAFRFDLFVTPDWSARFDKLVADHVEYPAKGRLLEINCGTGSRVIAVAEALKEGEVVGAEEDPERVAIARAKVLVANAERCSFVEANPEHLSFEDASFDGVLADTSLTRPDRLAGIASEAARVAKPGAPVALKVLLRGSFGEFFSIYWEALHDVGIDAETWAQLELMITEPPTLQDAIDTVRKFGVRDVHTHRSQEEWRFENAEGFLASPLVTDLFLDEWLSIVPESRIADVRAAIARIVDEQADGAYFDVSAKALVVAGHK